MAKVRTRVLVIDASVARASGDTSMHPTSRSCREFLQGVLDICHRAAMSLPVREEWDKHQSRFARGWRVAMMARKKILPIEGALPSLETRLSRTESDRFVRAIMEKDRRLIEAALAADSRVISLDEKVRTQFKSHSLQLAEIRLICWVNPVSPEENACEWLRAGAPADRSRTLGFGTPSE